MSRPIDLDGIATEAATGARPRHALKQLADRLGAQVHAPAGETPNVRDRLWGKLVGTPHLWAYARALVGRLTNDDVIYCPDEAIGLPLAALCAGRRDRPRLVIMIHNVDRPRTKVAMRIRPGFRAAQAYISVSGHQVDFLLGLGIDEDRALFVADQTDLAFFNPGPADERPRPLLVGAGLERRDYKVFAEAIAGLDVDVSITGFSADAAPGKSSFPETWPANFVRKRYEWRDLAQLYRDADAVVVTLLPNIYAAGITTMVEGMASGCPVVVTRTPGLKGYLDDTDALTLVPGGDAAQLREAIVRLLEHRDEARAKGLRGLEIARARYGSDFHVETIAELMQRVAGA